MGILRKKKEKKRKKEVEKNNKQMKVEEDLRKRVIERWEIP